MKSLLHWQADQSSEFSSYSDRQPTFWSKLRDTWEVAIAYFAASSEPHVWKSQDASGSLQWKAYDPITGSTAEYSSEADMRTWLEERHYQYHRFTR